MNVVPLPRPVKDEKLVALLEELLAEARAGKIKSLVGVVFHADTHYGQRMAHNAFTMQGVGAAHLLLSWLTQRWEAAPSLPEPTDPAA